jgi:ketosteroid isomerase-like protein
MAADRPGVTLDAAMAALAAYARAVDDRDLDTLAALVTEDVAVHRIGGNLLGRTAFVDYYRTVAAAGAHDHHAISNVAIEGHADDGTRVLSSFVNHRRHRGRLHVVQGRYEHQLVPSEERALIRWMRIDVTGVAVLAAEFPEWTG